VASRALGLVSQARALVELTQDVPKPPVYLLEHGDMLIRRPARQPAQPGHGLVDPLISRWGEEAARLPVPPSGPLVRLMQVFIVHVRYPPRGTLPSDVD
jgi:hypothetical protein